MDIDAKVAIGFVGVILGWLLNQWTAWLKQAWVSRRLKRGLREELEDMKYELQRIVISCARQLQIAALKGVEPRVPLPVTNLFFRQHYKDVFDRLTRQQRLSLQLIHSSIDALNKQIEALAKCRDKCTELQGSNDKAGLTQAIAQWGDHVKAIFKNARVLQWHIEYHLVNDPHPTLEFQSNVHEEFLQFKQKTQDQVQDILQKAETLSREDFDRIYDEKAFAKARERA